MRFQVNLRSLLETSVGGAGALLAQGQSATPAWGQQQVDEGESGTKRLEVEEV